MSLPLSFGHTLLTCLSALAAGALAVSGPSLERRAEPSQAPTEQVGEETDLERFAKVYPFRDPRRWVGVDVEKSDITGTRRRIYFEKQAVTTALLGHAGGRGLAAAPMAYPDGTVFVAQTFVADGVLRDTAVMIVRRRGDPEFLLFDGAGVANNTFEQARDPREGPTPGNTPRVCVGCHLGEATFDPMKSFPEEPEGYRLLIDKTYRDIDIVLHFMESYHRGDRVFGPYGSIWLAKLKADEAAGKLVEEDRLHFQTLRERYKDLLE